MTRPIWGWRGALVKTPNVRAKPIVWEPERVERWKVTGEVAGPVMVWTDDLLVQFLDYAAEHAPALHPLLHFMAYRGPRRGEASGLLDAEVRLGKGEVSIVNQIAAHGYETYLPKRGQAPAAGALHGFARIDRRRKHGHLWYVKGPGG